MAEVSLTPAEREDSRFTYGLIYDVTQALESHGYRLPGDSDSARHRALGRTLMVLLDLTRAYEGQDIRREAPPNTAAREVAPNTASTDGR
jgi:hypothetical protein